MQTGYNPYMSMEHCMSCPYMMQSQNSYMGAQWLCTPYMAPEQYPTTSMPGMKREESNNAEENNTELEENQYRIAPFGPRPFFRPRPFFPPFFFPRPFFPPFFFPPFFPPFFFPPFFPF